MRDSYRAKKPFDDPYKFAKDKNIKVNTLGDYLRLLDLIFQEAIRRGAAVLKKEKLPIGPK